MLRSVQVKYGEAATCALNFNCTAVASGALAANATNADASLAAFNIVDEEAVAALCCQPIAEEPAGPATVDAWIADVDACKGGECLHTQLTTSWLWHSLK
jgi:hypothetical protein